MEQECQKVYAADDIYRAFDMGLSSAIFVLERSLVLDLEDRMHMIEVLRRMVKDDKGYEIYMI
jgi:hypothetical protein